VIYSIAIAGKQHIASRINVCIGTLIYRRTRSQTQGCYTIANRCLKLTHVPIFLAHFPPAKPLMDAIIFAAGRGERLRPLTDTCPKPLLKIQGLSLIEIHLLRLASAGYQRVIINVHHLGGQIRDQLGNGERYGLNIIYSVEVDHALETAGGIVHALKYIRSACFAAISADVLCDFDYSLLPNMAQSGSRGNLVLVENPPHHPHGDFTLDSDGKLLSTLNGRSTPAYTFSGIACFERAQFETLPPGKRALRPVLESAIAQQSLYGRLHNGFWSDIGSLERLQAARQSERVSKYIDSIR